MTEVKGVTWDFDGNQIDRKNALALCYAQGFNHVHQCITAASVMTAESQRYAKAWHHNHEHDSDGNNVVRNDTGEIIILSTDRGLFQINDVAQPNVSEEEAFDAKINVDAAHKIYRTRGDKFTAWAAYNSGAYLKYVPEFTVVWLRGSWRKRIEAWS
jgi:urease accessory protein UreH